MNNIRGSCKTSDFTGNTGILPVFFKDLRTRCPRSQRFCKNLIIKILSTFFEALMSNIIDERIHGGIDWIFERHGG